MWAVCAVILLAQVRGYEIPPVDIEVHSKGFTASIPDAPGVGLFSFNGNLNSAISSSDVGDSSGEVLEPTQGRWRYRNDDVTLRKGDVLHYWVMVSVDRLGYIKDNLKFEYDGEPTVASPTTTTTASPIKAGRPPCLPTVTTVGGRSACAGHVIFQDTFDKTSANWQFEHHIPSRHPDYPFVSYQNLASVIGVRDGKLAVTPALLQTLAPYSVESIRSGTLDLFQGCTDAADSCSLTASGFDILPPVVTGRANTKYSFTFKYGVVEIRAKLVRGDWLYPELLLEPFINKYGRDHFSSGVVVLATARGNQELRSGTDQIGHGRLLAGLVVDRFQCHDRLLFSKLGQAWSADYHNYKVVWKPDGLTWYVDGVEFGRLRARPSLSQQLQGCSDLRGVFQRWALGDQFAPFDQEFYLTLGLSAGGITMFPDNSVSSLGRNKPWRNRSSKARLHFWQDLDRWYNTWSEESTLLVDSVKVTAL